MTGLEEKSKKNEELAMKLIGDGYYDAAVNRFYYSIYQKLFVHATSCGYSYNRSEEGGTHVQLQNYFRNQIKSLMYSDDAEVRVRATQLARIEGDYIFLKQQRTLADYQKEAILKRNIGAIIDKKNSFNRGFDTFCELLKS